MALPIDGFSSGAKLVRERLSDIAAASPAAVYSPYETGSLDSARNFAYTSKTKPPEVPVEAPKPLLSEQRAAKSIVDLGPDTAEPPRRSSLSRLMPTARSKDQAPMDPNLRRAVEEESRQLPPELDFTPTTRSRSNRALEAPPVVADRAPEKLAPPAQKDTTNDLAEFLNRPQYSQFKDANLPCTIDHKIDMTSTSVKLIAEAGNYKYWSLQTVRRQDGSSSEFLCDNMGRQRYALETNGQHWKLTEFNYSVRDGRETPWRSSVREISSDGSTSIQHYDQGQELVQRRLASF